MNMVPKPPPHPAEVACEFMSRADMKGREVDIYAQTYNWLQEFLAGELVTIHPNELKAMQNELDELRHQIIKKELPTLKPIDTEGGDGCDSVPDEVPTEYPVDDPVDEDTPPAELDAVD